MPVSVQLQSLHAPSLAKLADGTSDREGTQTALAAVVDAVNVQLSLLSGYVNQAGGHKSKGVTVNTLTYAVSSVDGSLFFDSSALNPVATLPKGINYPDMQIMGVEEIGGGVSTLAAATGDTIEGAASVVVTTGKRWAAYVGPTGTTNWRKVLG